MAVNVSVGRALKRLRGVSPAARRRASLEVVRSALKVQRRAKELCPVDTGRLRNSIAVADAQTTPDLRSDQLPEQGAGWLSQDTMAAIVGTNVEYAPYVHFGTRRMTERPFLFVAYEEERGVFLRRLEKAVREEVRKL